MSGEILKASHASLLAPCGQAVEGESLPKDWAAFFVSEHASCTLRLTWNPISYRSLPKGRPLWGFKGRVLLTAFGFFASDHVLFGIRL